jgi:hypothetical protein
MGYISVRGTQPISGYCPGRHNSPADSVRSGMLMPGSQFVYLAKIDEKS